MYNSSCLPAEDIDGTNFNIEFIDEQNNLRETSNLSSLGGRRTLLPAVENKMLSVSLEDEFLLSFLPGSLVWAKVNGHPDPPWPAKVLQVNEKNDKMEYKVKFFGTEDWAWVKENELWEYTANTVEKFEKADFGRKFKRRKLFRSAIEDIKKSRLESPAIPDRIYDLERKDGSRIPLGLPVSDPSGFKDAFFV